LSIEIGLVLALILLVTAARMHLVPSETDFQVRLQTQEVVEMEEIKQTEQQTKAPPPPKAPVPVEVPDNTVIEQEAGNFDASLDLSDSLNVAMGPPTPDAPDPKPDEDRTDDEIFVAVEQQPDCGGISAVQKAADYPAFAEKAGIEGRVFVQFVVDESGDVTNPKVTRGVHKLLNEEALEAVQELECTPGRQRGTPVKVQLTLPVTFELKKDRPPSNR
jgi:protein TonB